MDPLRIYTVPSIFTLSEDASVESILAEIPFYSVGLLGFAVLTFFIVLKRGNIPTVYLLSSVLVAFVASILDLGQVLARGSTNIVLGTDTDSVKPLIIVREVGFALSFGLRFLFFWTFVAECPLYEACDGQGMHSGSWDRWGYVGSVLKWILLLLSNAIPILQLFWRLDSSLAKFGPLYDTESTIQIVTSALFIIKILLNVSVTPVTPRWKIFRLYSAVIIALLFSMTIGIGNVIYFAFSESILGRFLQAVELYILILFIMIYSFYGGQWTPRVPSTGEPSFKGLPVTMQRGSMFKLDPPNGLTPGVVTLSRPDNERRNTRMSLVSRHSSSSMSAWLQINTKRMTARFRPTQDESDTEGLRAVDEAEKGNSSNFMNIIEEVPRSSVDNSPLEPKESARWKDPIYTNMLYDSPPEMDGLSVVEPFRPTLPHLASSNEIDPQRTIAQTQMDFLDVSVTEDNSSKTRTQVSRTDSDEVDPERPRNLADPAPSEPAESVRAGRSPDPVGAASVLEGMLSANDSLTPIYGMNGPLRLNRQTQFSDSVYSPRSSTGVDSLLRQAEELDKSIAHLHLFEPSTTDRGSSSRSKVASDVRSSFSLSHFPAPPWASRDDMAVTSSSMPEEQDLSTSRRPNSMDSASFVMMSPPSRLPGADPAHRREISDVPSTLRPSMDSERDLTPTANRNQRMGSQGTQYEITSFIAAGHSKNHSAGSSPDSAIVTTAQRLSGRTAARPLVISTPMQDQTGPSPLRNQLVDIRESPTNIPTESPRRLAPARAGGPGLPSSPRPRPYISNPRLQTRRSVVSDDSGIFERPRPPPLMLKPRGQDAA